MHSLQDHLYLVFLCRCIYYDVNEHGVVSICAICVNTNFLGGGGGGVNYFSFIKKQFCHAILNIAMYTLFMNVAMDLYTSLYLGMDL